MTSSFLYTSLALILFAAAFAWYDARQLKQYKWIDDAGHALRWMIRFQVVFTGVILITGARGQWWELLIYLGLLFWIVFDPLLAWMRGLSDPFFYKGNTAFLDRIFPAVGYQILTKISLLVLAIYAILK